MAALTQLSGKNAAFLGMGAKTQQPSMVAAPKRGQLQVGVEPVCVTVCVCMRVRGEGACLCAAQQKCVLPLLPFALAVAHTTHRAHHRVSKSECGAERGTGGREGFHSRALPDAHFPSSRAEMRTGAVSRTACAPVCAARHHTRASLSQHRSGSRPPSSRAAPLPSPSLLALCSWLCSSSPSSAAAHMAHHKAMGTRMQLTSVYACARAC